jgi:hypothetical protein
MAVANVSFADRRQAVSAHTPLGTLAETDVPRKN